MRLAKFTLTLIVLAGTSLSGMAMSHARRGPTSPRIFSHKAKGAAVKASPHHAGMTATGHPTQIDPVRAAQIQTALIKSGYLSGEATGRWDSDTQAALRKLQGDNGWQTKITPDSRAIIKLGLGPGSNHAEEASNLAAPLTSAN